MTTDKQPSSYQGMGFLPALALIFITLKLCGVIGWSWLWVLAPIWIPFSLVCLIFGGILAVVIVVGVIRAFTKP